MPTYVTFPLGLSLLIPMCGTTMYMEARLAPSHAIDMRFFLTCNIISVMVEVKGTPHHHGNVGNE